MVPSVLMVPKTTGVVDALLHNVWSAGSFTCPVGFTVMVNDLVDPAQEVLPFVKVGVTTIVAITGDVPELVAVNADISPEPLLPRPILVVVFVHV